MGEAKRKQQIAGRCYLCGGTGLTKQHLWPNWATPYLEVQAQGPGSFGRTVLRSKNVADGQGRVVFQPTETFRPTQGQPNQLKYRKFCETCNNVWMSRIEQSAKPFAEPLMKGEPCTLDEHAQTVLARWLSLVLIVVEAGDAESATISVDARRKFHADGHPLDGLQLFIASLDGGAWRCKLWHQAFRLSSDKYKFQAPADGNNLQVTTIGMGNCLVYMVGSLIPGLDVSEPTLMRQIWPYLGEMNWPLPDVWFDADADRLSRFLSNQIVTGARPVLG